MEQENSAEVQFIEQWYVVPDIITLKYILKYIHIQINFKGI